MSRAVAQPGGKEKNMNSVNIIGRLVRDPETKRTDDGRTVCSLRLAIDDTYSKDGRADFINVTVFGGQGDVCERYLKKGFLTGVTGHIRTDSYTDSEGVKRYPIKLIAERVQILTPKEKRIEYDKQHGGLETELEKEPVPEPIVPENEYLEPEPVSTVSEI